MYDDKTDQPAKVNNTDLCEDLGQIEYLFTDKTGTLTENQMVFKHFGLDGKIYEQMRGHIYEVGINDEPGQIQVILALYSGIKLCIF
jgi:P-type E1-E2 ATPase